MTSFKVRRTEWRDIDAVAAVLADGKRSLAELGISQWQWGDYPGRADVEADVEEGISYLAEDRDGRIAATAALSFAGDGNYAAIEGAWLCEPEGPEVRYGTLHRTASSRANARQGAMKAIFLAAEDIARDRGALSLRVDTHPLNAPMRSLLGRLGYAECGLITLAGDDPDPVRVAYEKPLT